jgi:predicted lipoprotein with Yx(FWY)xxD motif
MPSPLTRLPRISIAIATAVLAAALGLAACGGDDNSSSDTTTSASASSGGGETVNLADAGDLGQVLVSPDGRTLYLFEKDTSGDASSCSGACAQDWPPLTVKGDASAGSGVEAGQLTTFKREDGDTQVAYQGHPLYYYAGDAAPGDTNGNGLDQFGAEWYALDASGQVVEGSEDSGSDEGSDDSSESDSSSSGGYSY